LLVIVGPFADRILLQDGAFDEAVKRTNEIIHVASPVHTNVTDPYKGSVIYLALLSALCPTPRLSVDFIDPAMNGTVSILKSALKM
jgi:hypothetical protein